MKRTLFVVVTITLINVSVFSQGKILSKENANEMFGAVLISNQISTETLKLLVNNSTKVIMFNFINNDVYILDNKRRVLLPAGFSVNSSEVFHVFATSIVNELLSSGNNSDTYIEKRQEVLTVTNGNYTLEFAWLCPPFCVD